MFDRLNLEQSGFAFRKYKEFSLFKFTNEHYNFKNKKDLKVKKLFGYFY